MTEVQTVVGLGAFLPCNIRPMDTGDGNDINVSLTLSLFTFHMAKAEKSNHG